jgi:site-specific DNA recombinase
MTTGNPKCFVYFRRSQDREDRQYNSLEKQERNTREVVKKNGLDAIHLPPEERSAKYPGRPIFNDMMERIEAGEAQYIAV